MSCATCGLDKVIMLTLQSPSGPYEKCSRCWRDSGGPPPEVKPPDEVSPELVDALKQTGWTEHEIPGRPGVVRMEPPLPRKRKPSRNAR